MTHTASYYVSRLEKGLLDDVITVLRRVNPDLADKTTRGAKIGEVKDYTSLVQLSQNQGVPLSEVKGAAPAQKNQARGSFESIAKAILRKVSRD